MFKKEKLYYFARVNFHYVNVINLASKPLKLKDCMAQKEAIVYDEKEIDVLKKFYPNLETEVYIKNYKLSV
jgi:hypothetical protein